MNLRKLYVDRYTVLGSLLVLSAPFFTGLPNVLLMLLCGIYIVDVARKKTVPDIGLWMPLGVLFLYLLIKSTVLGTVEEDSRVFGRFFIVFALPLILLKMKDVTLMAVHISMVVIAIVIAAVNLINFIIHNSSISLANGVLVNQLLVVERPYFGFISLIGIIICGKLYFQFPSRRVWIVTLGTVFTAHILFLAARLSLLTLIILTVTFLFVKVRAHLWKKVFFTVAGALLLGLTMYMNGNLKERFTRNTEAERIHLYDPRVVIWKCASEIISGNDFNWLTGLDGYSTITEKYVGCHKTKNNDDFQRKQYFITKEFNSHNQFIDFFLYGGSVGLILFLWFIVKLHLLPSRNFYTFALAVSLTLFFVFENVFHRQFGCYLIAIVLVLIDRGRIHNGQTGKLKFWSIEKSFSTRPTDSIGRS